MRSDRIKFKIASRCFFSCEHADLMQAQREGAECADPCPDEPIHYHHNRRPHENNVHKQAARQPGISRQPISSPSSLPGCPDDEDDDEDDDENAEK